eukprot:553827-Pleurochrysis_carterae.AAC.1
MSAVRRGTDFRTLASTGKASSYEVSERLRYVARHIDVGQSDGSVAPDLARSIALTLARGNLAP